MAKLSEKAFAEASVAVAVLLDAAGYVWHGLLQQPSIMSQLYPGFWSSTTLMLMGLAGTVVAAYITGYAFAWIYNKQEKQ